MAKENDVSKASSQERIRGESLLHFIKKKIEQLTEQSAVRALWTPSELHISNKNISKCQILKTGSKSACNVANVNTF